MGLLLLAGEDVPVPSVLENAADNGQRGGSERGRQTNRNERGAGSRGPALSARPKPQAAEEGWRTLEVQRP